MARKWEKYGKKMNWRKWQEVTSNRHKAELLSSLFASVFAQKGKKGVRVRALPTVLFSYFQLHLISQYLICNFRNRVKKVKIIDKTM